jgi:hypothetical protein
MPLDQGDVLPDTMGSFRDETEDKVEAERDEYEGRGELDSQTGDDWGRG